jgi:hypothetical protein
LLALTRHAEGALAILDQSEFHSAAAFRHAPEQLIGRMFAAVGVNAADLIVMSSWGAGARATLYQAVAANGHGATVIDIGICLGDALAATPALAWCVALDLLQSGQQRALILNAGIDGGIGFVVLRRLS